MARVLEETEVDILEDELDSELSVQEQRALAGLGVYQETSRAPDLTECGEIAGATLFPVQGGERKQTGRPTVRQAWMWDGTPSELPLAWNTDGTMHDGARRYRLKRHCLCCNESGFRGKCPRCIKTLCPKCKAGADRSKLIPNFYLQYKDVPFPKERHPVQDCFLPSCMRRGENGFESSEEMRMHATKRHKDEYAAHLQTEAANRRDETDDLRQRVDQLTSLLLRQQNGSQPMAKEQVPLYVSDKPKRKRIADLTDEQRTSRRESNRKAQAAVRAARKRP